MDMDTSSEDSFPGSEDGRQQKVSSSHKLADFGNLLKSFVGTQYITLSYGFLQSGILLGFVAVFGVATLTTHCCELIVKCKYYMIDDVISRLEKDAAKTDNRREYDLDKVRAQLMARLTVIDLGQYVWGRVGSTLVSLCLLVTQIGFCVAYHIFIGNIIWAIILYGFADSPEPYTAIENNSKLTTQSEPPWDTPALNQYTDNRSSLVHYVNISTLTSAELELGYADARSIVTTAVVGITDNPSAWVSDPAIGSTPPGDAHWEALSPDQWLIVLVVLPLPFFMLFALFRRVRGIGPVSVLANIIVGFCFLILFIYICLDFSLGSGIELAKWSTAAIMLGQAAASYEAVGTLLFIESSMVGNHHNFPRYLRLSIGMFTLLFTPLALLGYLRFGTDTEQILFLNLQQNILVITVELVAVVGVLLTYPIQVFPVTEMAEGLVFGRHSASADFHPLLEERDFLHELGLVSTTVVPKNTSTWQRNLLRVSLSICIALLAVLFRNSIAYAGALVGALGSTPLAFILPCVFQLKLRWSDLELGVKVKDITIIVVSSILAVGMSVVTLMQAVVTLQQ